MINEFRINTNVRIGDYQGIGIGSHTELAEVYGLFNWRG